MLPLDEGEAPLDQTEACKYDIFSHHYHVFVVDIVNKAVPAFWYESLRKSQLHCLQLKIISVP